MPSFRYADPEPREYTQVVVDVDEAGEPTSWASHAVELDALVVAAVNPDSSRFVEVTGPGSPDAPRRRPRRGPVVITPPSTAP